MLYSFANGGATPGSAAAAPYETRVDRKLWERWLKPMALLFDVLEVVRAFSAFLVGIVLLIVVSAIGQKVGTGERRG